MKKIFNWRNAVVFDIEADSLLDEATKIHVLSHTTEAGVIKSVSSAQDIKDFFLHCLENNIPVVAHNGISFDIPLVEKLLGLDLSSLMVIDTLMISWALNPTRQKHGLDSFHKDYGIKKPEITDWVGLTYEEYKHRCVEDVKINIALWDDFKVRLTDLYTKVKIKVDEGEVGGKRVSQDEVLYIDRYVHNSTVDEYVDRYLTFLMYKGDTGRLREKTKFLADVPHIEKMLAKVEAEVEKAKAEIESIMPDVPIYAIRKSPKKPYKGKDPYFGKAENSELSSTGIGWKELAFKCKSQEVDHFGCQIVTKIEPEQTEREVLDADGKRFMVDDGNGGQIPLKEPWVRKRFKVLIGYDRPNANSPEQVKKFLDSKGWEPESFKFEKDEEAMQEWVDGGFRGKKPKPRAIPQITIDGEGGKVLCPSVERLAEECPEISKYAKYGMIKHRYGLFKGFVRDLKGGNYLTARVGGYTNTLRDKHRELVNLPDAKKAYGKELRGSLIAGDGKIALGSDMSSLEDRVKHCFMMAHDPEYVKTMTAPDYDPHITMALTAGLITQKEFDEFMKGNKSDHANAQRKKGKGCNYACLPTDNTEVLTDSGWVNIKNVTTKDRVLTLKGDTDELRFSPVEKTYLFPEEEVKHFSAGRTSLESTNDHRWLVDVRRQQGFRGRRYTSREYLVTGDLTSEASIVTTGLYQATKGSCSPDEAFVLGCILADGSLDTSKLTKKTSQKGGNRQQVRMSLSQSKKKFYDLLVEKVKSVGLSYKESVNNSGVNVLRFSSSSARAFLERVGIPLKSKHDIDYTSWLMKQDQETLSSLFEGFWLCDGNTAKSGTRYNTKIIYQNSGNICDAIQLCSYLLGRTTYVSGLEYKTIRSQDTNKIGLQKSKELSRRSTEVACLTTRDSNFVIRQNGFITVTGNCVYGAGAEAIARASGVTTPEGKVLHTAYWDLNWSVKAIADDQCVIKDSKGKMWLINPINGFCYSLRAEKDIFSTLCQGTGSFFFDRWVDYILEGMQEVFGCKRLSACFHDEVVIVFKDSESNRSKMAKILQEAIQKVNKEYLLRRDLGIDVQYGDTYADIH